MRLLNQSTRATIRTITLIAALTSLLLTMLTPFVGTADATLLPGSQFDATDATLDTEEGIMHLPDACPRKHPGTDDGPINGDSTKLNVIHDDVPPTINPDINHPGHSDLCDIWIGSEVVDGQFLLYLAWEREAKGGSSGAYWEFQQSGLACTTNAADCNPFANRQEGDFIIHFDFQGNSLDDIILRFFDGTSFGPGVNPSDFLPDPAGEASTSTDRLFGEAVLNLTELQILDPNADECETFAGVIPGSATGNSDSSDYKDIVLTDEQPRLTNCGEVVVQKVSSTGDDYGDTFPITLTGDGGTIDRTEDLGHGGSFAQSDAFADNDYAVSEQVPDGWSIDSIVCSDGSSSGEGVTELTGITVEAGETTTCTVTNSPDLPELTIVKQVINDDGGSAEATDFTVRSNGDAVTLDAESPAQGFDSQASTTVTVAPGDYTISEDDPAPAYALTGIDCSDTDGGATATLGLGDTVTCTVVNDDQPGELILEKEIIDPDGLYPDVTRDDFVPTIDGDDADWDSNTVDAGTYSIGEDDADGSTLLADGTFVQSSTVCDGEETSEVTVANGQTSTCTITNTAVGAGLTVIKDVDNDWGGELEPSDFPLTVNGESVASGVAATFPAGDYTVAEEQQTGYELSDSFCTRNGETVNGISGESFDISVGPGETVICTFVNQDIPATITLDKTVVNDNGGTLEQDDFPSFLDDAPLAWDTPLQIAAGGHTASETPQAGYAAGDWGGDCAADGTFTAELATDYVCTITNDDIGGELTIEKVVINDDGGTASADDFVPTLGYEPPAGTEPTFAISGTVTWGTFDADAGTYTIGELLDVPGYVLDDIACQRNGDTFASSTSNNLVIEVGLDDDVTCTVTNNDVPAGLTVVKEVVNDDDGSLGVEDFPLLVTPEGGDTEVVESGAANTLPAGTYTIGEEQQAGYTLDSIVCDNGVEAADGEETVTVTVANGESVVCTITNNDPEPVVLGEQFEDPEPKPAPTQLPRTGFDTGRLALWAILITALGILTLVVTAPAPAATRRRA